MKEEIEELIKEIAVNHGIAVGRDDPILILQTINNRLMQNSMKAQQEILDQFKAELEEMSQRWGTDIKAKAERILNATLDASKDTMEKQMKQGAIEIVSRLDKETKSVILGMVKPLNIANRIAIMNLIAAGATLISTGILAWIVVRF